jgi:hypothetical protein
MGYKVYTEKQKGDKIKSSLFFKAFMSTAYLDKRVFNYSGRNFKINDIKLLEEENQNLTYSVLLTGIRGNSGLTFKLKKHTYEDLLIRSERQINYSILSKEDRLKNIYLPQDFNDVIVPTEETLNKYTQNNSFLNTVISNINYSLKRIANVEEAITYKNYIKSNNKFINIDDYSFDKNNSIFTFDKKDTFWVLSSITMSAADNVMYNIRPLGKNHRQYNIEDTFFKYHNFSTIINKLNCLYTNCISQFSESNNGELSREELIIKKQVNFDSFLDKRKKVMVINLICFMFFGGIYLYYSRNRLGIDGFNSLKEALNTNTKFKQIMGGFYDINYTTYKFFPKDGGFYKCSFIAYGPKAKAEITALLEFNSVSNSHIMSGVTIKTKSDENNEEDLIRLNNTYVLSPNEFGLIKMNVDENILNMNKKKPKH